MVTWLQEALQASTPEASKLKSQWPDSQAVLSKAHYSAFLSFSYLGGGPVMTMIKYFTSSRSTA